MDPLKNMKKKEKKNDVYFFFSKGGVLITFQQVVLGCELGAPQEN